MNPRRFLIAAAVCLSLALPCSAAWQVGLQDGCVALLQNGTVVQRTDTAVSFLPRADRELLQFHLLFLTREAACRMMEDLTG